MILHALVLLAASVSPAPAEENTGGVARMMVTSASTTFAGKKVSENEVLKTVGALKTGAEGGAKLKLTGNNVVVEMAANSEINLVLPPSGDPSDSIELIKGKVRVRVPKAKMTKGDPKGEKPRFLLRHKKMTMGVRGTDFFATADEDLDETELVVFEGQVEFANEKSPTETQRLSASYWSGIGGRFGDKIQTPKKLSPRALEAYDRASRATPAFTLQPVSPEKAPGDSSTTGH